MDLIKLFRCFFLSIFLWTNRVLITGAVCGVSKDSLLSVLRRCESLRPQLSVRQPHSGRRSVMKQPQPSHPSPPASNSLPPPQTTSCSPRGRGPDQCSTRRGLTTPTPWTSTTARTDVVRRSSSRPPSGKQPPMFVSLLFFSSSSPPSSLHRLDPEPHSCHSPHHSPTPPPAAASSTISYLSVQHSSFKNRGGEKQPIRVTACSSIRPPAQAGNGVSARLENNTGVIFFPALNFRAWLSFVCFFKLYPVAPLNAA